MSTMEQARRTTSEITILVAAAGILAGVVAAVGAATAAAAPSAEDHLAAAHVALESDAPHRAVYHLRRHLEREPHDAAARGLLARTCWFLGLRQAGLAEAHLALAADPTSEDALRVLAHAQHAGGQPDDALRTLRLIDEQLADDELAALAARCLHELGRHGEVELLLERLTATHPDEAAFHRLRGLNALHLPSPEGPRRAAESLRRATELEPESASAWNTLGFALEKQGELEDAWLAYVQAEGRDDRQGYADNRRRVEAALARGRT